MQRRSCWRSSVPRGRRNQARRPLSPRTFHSSFGSGSGSGADRLGRLTAGCPRVHRSYFRCLCDKDFGSAIQTLILCFRSLYGMIALGKLCLAGLAG